MSLHQLTSLTIGVPNVASASAFYEAFGLSGMGDGRFSTRDRGEQLRIVESPYRRVQEIAVGVDDADDLARLVQRLHPLATALRCGRIHCWFTSSMRT